MSNEDELCNLMNGVKINNQHYYFRLAKQDIRTLANAFCKKIKYNELNLELYNSIILNIDYPQLKIVIQYIITYGDALFNEYLLENKYCNINENPSLYLEEYLIRLNMVIELNYDIKN
jgi:hypothetical protein